MAAAARDYDFVVTTGGAANGDFDFIKPVVAELGELKMTTVNMRPGKAQTFGIVNGTPVFGLPGNPAAAYVGFEMLIRPALRTMQGFTHLDRSQVQARLTQDVKKKDPLGLVRAHPEDQLHGHHARGHRAPAGRQHGRLHLAGRPRGSLPLGCLSRLSWGPLRLR